MKSPEPLRPHVIDCQCSIDWCCKGGYAPSSLVCARSLVLEVDPKHQIRGPVKVKAPAPPRQERPMPSLPNMNNGFTPPNERFLVSKSGNTLIARHVANPSSFGPTMSTCLSRPKMRVVSRRDTCPALHSWAACRGSRAHYRKGHDHVPPLIRLLFRSVLARVKIARVAKHVPLPTTREYERFRVSSL